LAATKGFGFLIFFKAANLHKKNDWNSL